MNVETAIQNKAARRNWTLPPQNMLTPIPHDFKMHASEPIKDLIKRYGASAYLIGRWCKDIGLPPRRAKAKIDTQELDRLLKQGVSAKQIASKFGVNRKHILRAAKRIGYDTQEIARESRAQPLPADFADKFHTMSYESLADYYNRKPTTIKAWATRAGLKRIRPAVTPATRLSRARPVERPSYQRSYAAPRLVTHHKAIISEVRRDNTEAGKAQEILQRDKWVVYRCDANGRQDTAGKLWRCGRLIVTDAELIERAESVTSRNLEKAA